MFKGFLLPAEWLSPGLIEIEHNGPWKWHVWYFYVFRASIWYCIYLWFQGVPYPTTKERGSLHRVGTGHCSLPGMWSPWSPGQISKKSRQIRCLNFKTHQTKQGKLPFWGHLSSFFFCWVFFRIKKKKLWEKYNLASKNFPPGITSRVGVELSYSITSPKPTPIPQSDTSNFIVQAIHLSPVPTSPGILAWCRRFMSFGGKGWWYMVGDVGWVVSGAWFNKALLWLCLVILGGSGMPFEMTGAWRCLAFTFALQVR